MKYILRLVLLALVVGSAWAAKPDDSEALFTNEKIFQFGLEITPENIALLHSSDPLNSEDRPEVPATFIYESKRYEVKVKLKGQWGSFRNFDTKPGFKIKFIKDKFFGLKRLTLNNNAQDVTLTNQFLVYKVYAAAGIASPRVGYAWLKINNEDFGLYTNFETQDELFLKRNYKDPSGNLYENGDVHHDLLPKYAEKFKQDEGKDESKSDLKALTTAVSTLPVDELFYGSKAPFEISHLLSWLAVEVVTGEADGYVLKPHNYRIYHEPASNRWTFIPTGRDQSFKKRIRPVEGVGVLLKKCLESKRCLADYKQKLNEVAAIMRGLGLTEMLDRTLALIDQAGIDDPRGLQARGNVRHERIKLRRRFNSIPNEIEVVTECEERKIGEVTFAICPVPKTFDEAKKACKALGMSLAYYDNKDQMLALDAHFTAHADHWWIGLYGTAPDFKWVATNEAPSFSAWKKAQPDNQNLSEHCTEEFSQYNGGGWNDLPCASSLPFVCRR